jgi:hypothetical protein
VALLLEELCYQGSGRREDKAAYLRTLKGRYGDEGREYGQGRPAEPDGHTPEDEASGAAAAHSGGASG